MRSSKDALRLACAAAASISWRSAAVEKVPVNTDGLVPAPGDPNEGLVPLSKLLVPARARMPSAEPEAGLGEADEDEPGMPRGWASSCARRAACSMWILSSIVRCSSISSSRAASSDRAPVKATVNWAALQKGQLLRQVSRGGGGGVGRAGGSDGVRRRLERER
jgi:hypothetical protein